MQSQTQTLTAKPLQHWIDNTHVAPASESYLAVENPATRETIAYCPVASTAEVDVAVKSAQRAYESWRFDAKLQHSVLIGEC